MDFEFVDDLPYTSGCKPDPLIVEFAAALRANPGRWAKYPKDMTAKSMRSLASSITNSNKSCPPALREGFEGACRSGVLYVRALPGAGA